MSFATASTARAGNALLICTGSTRQEPTEVLGRVGMGVMEIGDPYAAMAELCRRPLYFRAMVLCLQSLYPEELELVATVKRRFRHVDVWLANTHGRQDARELALNLGADGVVADGGLLRLRMNEPTQGPAATSGPHATSSPPSRAYLPGGTNGNGGHAARHPPPQNPRPDVAQPALPTPSQQAHAKPTTTLSSTPSSTTELERRANEPLLSADELRALLQEEQP
ncbi:MAG: hypothetical protein ACFCVE_10020 [Phycisphaerae bacterium]